MARVMTDDRNYSAIADAIRTRKNLPATELEHIVEYEEAVVNKYVATSNVDLETGDPISNGYGDNVAWTQVITIEGAEGLTISYQVQTESTSYDWGCIWEGAHPEYTANGNWNQTDCVSGKLGGNTKSSGIWRVTGDTVTIAFKSDSSNSNYYGFWCNINGIGKVITRDEWIEKPINRFKPAEMPSLIERLVLPGKYEYKPEVIENFSYYSGSSTFSASSSSSQQTCDVRMRVNNGMKLSELGRLRVTWDKANSSTYDGLCGFIIAGLDDTETLTYISYVQYDLPSSAGSTIVDLSSSPDEAVVFRVYTTGFGGAATGITFEFLDPLPQNLFTYEYDRSSSYITFILKEAATTLVTEPAHLVVQVEGQVYDIYGIEEGEF